MRKQNKSIGISLLCFMIAIALTFPTFATGANAEANNVTYSDEKVYCI